MPGLSEQTIRKARRLIDQQRVREITPTRAFVVDGDHGTYTVLVDEGGATCACPAYGPCSHAAAEMQRLLGAVARSRPEIDTFVSAMAGTLPVPELFAPANVERIVAAAGEPHERLADAAADG